VTVLAPPQLPTQFPLSYCRRNMKRSLLLALLLSGVAVRAEGPDDLYLESFSLIEQAATIGKSGQSKNAIELLKQADTRLRKIQASYPSWNAGMVKFRLGDVAQRIANLDGTAADAPGTVASKPTSEAMAAGQEEQIRVLRSQVESLTAKLKEALEMQSSGLTAAERSRLEVKVANQQRELDVMKAALAQEKEKAAQAVVPAVDAEAVVKAKALAKENEALTQKVKQQAQELVNSSRAGADERDKLQKALAAAQAVVPAVDAEAVAKVKALANENEALTQKVKQQAQELVSSSRAGADERDKLQKALAAAQTGPAVVPPPATAVASAPSAEEKIKVAELQARLAALEATAVPYTAEERALFKAPPTRIVLLAETNSTPVKRSVKRVPPGAGALVAEADRAFDARNYVVAQQKFSEALKQEDDNVYLLSKLASAQFEQGKVSDAEKNLEHALRVDPADPASLTLMGVVRFQQERYSEALTFLSRSAQLDPNNADTQNYLGITLSQEGQRAAAEAALRKSVQLAPDNAGAHHNLAIIYATQKPPFIELAWFHYRKAVALGHPKNPGLEEILSKAAADK
jgi:tetratricopeptide (TPR) repeat protein